MSPTSMKYQGWYCKVCGEHIGRKATYCKRCLQERRQTTPGEKQGKHQSVMGIMRVSRIGGEKEMNEPTENQIREFWEWCGFKHAESPNEFIRRNWWTNPEHHCESHLPDIDLNNLFKFAVPKLDRCTISMNVAPSGDVFWNGKARLADDSREVVVTEDTPALALFWAIWEIMKGGK